MINKIRKLLGLCPHEWGKWEGATERWTNIYTNTRFTKEVIVKTCKTCGIKKRKVLIG